ncbi:MAG: hypothetical protein QE285_19370 [Aquabacterium sp.]|nr:hypothetical protein [Aquabacterium sp.]
MKRRQVLMVAGLIGAGALAIFGDGTPAPAADAVARPAMAPAMPTQVRNSPGASAATAAPAAVRTLRPRDGPTVAPMGRPQPLFPPQTWEAAAPAPAAAQPLAAAAPPQADSAPPLPFVYIGRRASGDVLEIYLAEGELVYVVRPPALLGSLYRVDAAHAGSIDFTYLRLNLTQRLPTPAAAP